MISPINNISFKGGCLSLGRNDMEKRRNASSIYDIEKATGDREIADYISTKFDKLKEDFDSASLPGQRVSVYLNYLGPEESKSVDCPPRVSMHIAEYDNEYLKGSSGWAVLGEYHAKGTEGETVYNGENLKDTIDNLFEDLKNDIYMRYGINENTIGRNKRISKIFDRLA